MGIIIANNRNHNSYIENMVYCRAYGSKHIEYYNYVAV